MQGIGQVIGEHVAYDSGGQLISGSFMDYFVPRAMNVVLDPADGERTLARR